MKKILLSGSVLAALAWSSPGIAADMLVKAPRLAPVSADQWTGLYVGGNVGYGWGTTDATGSVVTPGGIVAGSASSSFDVNGVVGGGQIGYNWQLLPQWIIGFETDIQGSGESGSTSLVCTGGVCGVPGVTASLSERLDWFGTIRGRIGYTFAPAWLAYFTGGGAYGHMSTSGNVAGAGFSPGNDITGWTIGGGLETKLGGQWSAKVEYLYTDYGRFSDGVSAPAAVFGVNSHFTDSLLRVGINYKLF
jgi:outer membrane immunogenic protein